MSSYDRWKKDTNKWETDPKAVKKNKELKARKSANRFRFFKAFWPTQDKLLREFITNWVIVVSFIVMVITASIGNKQIDQHTMSLQSLGVVAMVVLLSFITWVCAIIYRFMLAIRKRKGNYWPEKVRKYKED